MIQPNCASVRNIFNKGPFKNLNSTFFETKPQVSQRQFRNPRSGSSAVYVLQFNFYLGSKFFSLCFGVW